jgi:hypothetical protein
MRRATAMTRRFVFVPIFGDIGEIAADAERWAKGPHVKTWGFLDDENFTPIYADPPLQTLELGQPFDLFDAERRAITDVAENSTDLPDEVCLALAKFALLPVSRSNSDD